MPWNPIKRIIRKTHQVIHVVISKSEPCKVAGCFKDAWQDGYCPSCAHYFLMKEAVSAIQEHNDLIVKMATQSAHIPENPNQPATRDKHPKIVHSQGQPAFIPQIEVNEKANMTNIKKTIAQKDVRKLSKMLQEAQKSEVKFK